jgi:hypothetical protein
VKQCSISAAHTEADVEFTVEQLKGELAALVK